MTIDDKDLENDFLDQYLTLERGTERLEKIGKPITYPKNTVLFSPGDIPDHCFIVKKGRVIALEYSINGDQRIYNFMDPGSIFCEELMLFNKRCPVTFKTSQKSELIRIDKCDLKRAFKHDIDIVLDICESLTDKYLSAMESKRFIPNQGSEWKVANFFLMTARHYGVEDNGIVRITE